MTIPNLLHIHKYIPRKIIIYINHIAFCGGNLRKFETLQEEMARIPYFLHSIHCISLRKAI